MVVSIFKNLKPQTPVNDLEDAQQKLKSREETQQLMVAANKILRKPGFDVTVKLRELRLSKQTTTAMVTNAFGDANLHMSQGVASRGVNSACFSDEVSRKS